MDKKLINSLISYGLTENEARIYISLLKKLEASAFEISKDTNIPRATVYITLEKMKAEKIVSSLKKNNVQYFTPENPKALERLLEEKQKNLSEILPELNSIIDTSKESPNVHMYTGDEGVKIALDNILESMKRSNNHVLLAASQSEILDRLPKYFPEWMKRRESLSIKTKLILSELERGNGAFKPNELRETRYLPNNFIFKATVEIYGNKMAVFNLKEGEIYSIIIESEPIVQTFTQFFNFTWENAKN